MPFRRLLWQLPIYLLSGLLSPAFQRECRPEPASNPVIGIEAAPQGDLETELFMLTNRHRLQQGLPILSSDETLVRIAREHSLGMARQGFISHDSPEGNLQARMERGSYLYEVARENVASASTLAYAQNALMESPAHKNNILATDVDRVGIGIVRCAPPFERHLYITEIFATPRADYAPSAVQDEVSARVSSLGRDGAGLLPDPLLERLASDSVQLLNLPVKKEELRSVLAASAGELQKRGRTEIARVDASVQVVHDPKNLNILSRPRLGQEVRTFGTAVRRVLDSRNQPAFLVLTLIGFSN